MNQGLKRMLLLGLATLLCLHFFLITVYTSSLTNSDGKLKILSRMYVYPFFHQNWCLFVPAPNVKNSIYVRYQTNIGYTNWKDILSNEINKHKANRLIGQESVCLLFSNSLVYEFIDLSESGTKVYLQKPKNISFDILHFEISQYLKANDYVKSGTPCEYLLVSTNREIVNAYYFKSITIR